MTSMLVNRLRKRTRQEDGAVAVELVIITPILVIILFAIIQFGVIWSQMETYVSAAREGARYAAVRCQPDSSSGCTTGMVQARVATAAGSYWNPSKISGFSSSPTCGTSTIGGLVTVSWSQQLSYSIPFLGAHTYTAQIKGAFRCE